VTYKGEVLFTPEMGDFDMAVGKEIVSAFAGAADYLSFDIPKHVITSETIRVELSGAEKELNTLYKEVRAIREGPSLPSGISPKGREKLVLIFHKLPKNHPSDWLLALEIYELTQEHIVLEYLSEVKRKRPKVAHLIEGGLELIEKQHSKLSI
jgi:phenylalanine-4-hydroxylase